MELTARRMVDGFLSGKNKSNRHGFSVEFVEHREYVPGDDLRHLDWKVLGRLDRYYIKRYEEETNITAFLLIDSSRSMHYGSKEITKFEAAATAGAGLAYLLNRQRDSVGMALFDENIREYFPPSVKLVSLASMVAKLQDTEPQGKSSFTDVLQSIAARLRKRCLFILLSDFFVDQEDVEAGLKYLHYNGHDALVLQVLDDAELTFPFKNNTLFKGMEDKRELLTEPPRLKDRYLELLQEFLDSVEKLCQKTAFDYQLLEAGQPLGPALTGLLAARARQQRLIKRGGS